MKYITLSMLLSYIVIIPSCFTITGSTNGGTSYSPLYKYRNLPITKITNISLNDTVNVSNVYYKFKQDYNSHDGFIDNNEYYYILSNSVIFNSNGNLSVTYTFTNFDDITFLSANQKYVAYYYGHVLVVNNTNGNLVFTNFVLTKDIIVSLGKGDSPYLAYGERVPEPKFSIPSHGQGFYLKLYNLLTKTINTLPDSFSIVGFSLKGKYLFYTIYTHLWYYIDNLEQRPQAIGQLAYYNITKKENKIIGDISYESNTGITGKSWSDGIVGIDPDFEYFYVLQKRTQPYPLTGKLDDGRTEYEEQGLWKIDISTLGLSE